LVLTNPSTLINDALVTESATEYNGATRRMESQERTDSLILNILNATKKQIEKNKKDIKNKQKRRIEGRSLSNLQVQSVTSNSSDAEIARQYAPVLYLSSPGAVGVNLSGTNNYPYTDYIPIDVYDITSHPNNDAIFVNNITEFEEILTKNILDSMGGNSYNNISNYVWIEPIWNGTSVDDAYTQLTHHPTVYYRVLRDVSQENPLSVQYWFFYFFNDWLTVWPIIDADHPGDWETITVFLNSNAQPVEATYSTHYEANRHSWNDIDIEDDENIQSVGLLNPKVFVSNGGHGSYNHSGDTPYLGATDNHLGDREILFPDGIQASLVGTPYSLVNLSTLEDNNDSWIHFRGRWGNKNNAPHGPVFRTDVPTVEDYDIANNPPHNPYEKCVERYKTIIYRDPWFWASGYGLDGAPCEPIESITVEFKESFILDSKKAFKDKVTLIMENFTGLLEAASNMDDSSCYISVKDADHITLFEITIPGNAFVPNSNKKKYKYKISTSGKGKIELIPDKSKITIKIRKVELPDTEMESANGLYSEPFYITVKIGENVYRATATVRDVVDKPKKTKYVLDVSASGTITLLDSSSSTGSAKLNASADPNPVSSSSEPCISGSGDIPAWHYSMNITETNGVKVTISEFTWDFYDSNGNWLSQQVNDGNDFANWFNDCNEGSADIKPYGMACGALCTYLGGKSSGSVDMTFYGVDDYGNDVSASETVTLLDSSSPQLPPGLEQKRKKDKTGTGAVTRLPEGMGRGYYCTKDTRKTRK